MVNRFTRPVLSTIDIDAAPDQVWEHLADIERHTTWMADAESIRFETTQRDGVGTAFVCRTVVGPLRLDDRMEITEWDAPRAMGVRHTGLVSGTGRFLLTPIDLGRRTRMTWSESLQFPWWMGGPFGGLVGGRAVLGRIWRSNLRRLRDHIEGRAARSL